MNNNCFKYVWFQIKLLLCVFVIITAYSSLSQAEQEKTSLQPPPAETASQPLCRIKTTQMNINYHIEGLDQRDLDRVELWYGQNFTGNWQFYGCDDDKISPVRFLAPHEGVFRFLVVAVDRWGRWSCKTIRADKPNPGYNIIPSDVPAQQVVFIDLIPAPQAVPPDQTDNSSEPPAAARNIINANHDFHNESPPPAGSLPAANEDISRQNNALASPAKADSPNKHPIKIDHNRAIDCWNRGQLLSQRLEWQQAAKLYQQALDSDPQWTQPRVNLADTYYKMSKFEDAKKQFEICLQDSPHRATAWFGLAQTQIALKQLPQAEQTMENLLTQDPSDWQVWLMLGDIQNQLGQPTAARESWQKAAAGDLPTIKRIALERIKNYQP